MPRRCVDCCLDGASSHGVDAHFVRPLRPDLVRWRSCRPLLCRRGLWSRRWSILNESPF